MLVTHGYGLYTPQTIALFVPENALPVPPCVGTVTHEQLGTGNWAAGSVPVVISVAEIVTFDDNACPLTVVLVGTYPDIHDPPPESWHLKMLSDPTPSEKSIPLGTAIVKQVFNLSKFPVAGCSVQSGRIVRIRGEGVPFLREHGRGDLQIHIKVRTPTELNDEQKKLLRQLGSTFDSTNNVPTENKSFFDKVKDVFGGG